MSLTWAKHLQSAKQDLGSLHGAALGARAANLNAEVALLIRSRRDGKSVRISLAGVICDLVVVPPWMTLAMSSDIHHAVSVSEMFVEHMRGGRTKVQAHGRGMTSWVNAIATAQRGRCLYCLKDNNGALA